MLLWCIIHSGARGLRELAYQSKSAQMQPALKRISLHSTAIKALPFILLQQIWSKAGLVTANPYYPTFYDNPYPTTDTGPSEEMTGRYRFMPQGSNILDVSSLVYPQDAPFEDPPSRAAPPDTDLQAQPRSYGGAGYYGNQEGSGGYAYGQGYGSGPELPIHGNNPANGGRFSPGGPLPAIGAVGALGPNPYIPQLGRVMGGFGKFARPAYFPGFPFLSPYIGLNYVGKTDRYRGNYMVYNGDYDGYLPPTTTMPTTTPPSVSTTASPYQAAYYPYQPQNFNYGYMMGR